MKDCLIVDLGLMTYGVAWDLQRRIVTARKAGAISDVLLFCEHPHVITLGRNGKLDHLRASDHVLRQMNVEFVPTDRGGDITYHGPGQVIAYPILNLSEIRRDLVWYVRQLEEAMIHTTAEFGITARRERGKTGVWVDTPRGEEKLAAIGVHVSRWVTSHGLAYNVSTDLRYFDLIVPCGIADRRATSLERLLDRPVPLTGVKPRLAVHLGKVFDLSLRTASPGELQDLLRVHELEPAHAAAS